MIHYIIKKLFISAISVFTIATCSFFLLHMLPGNPFGSIGSLGVDSQARLMQYYGLDKPLVDQYIIYIKNLLHGDFGYSLKYTGLSVNEIIAHNFPYSAQLGLHAYAVSFPAGIFLGILSAENKGKIVDYAAILFSALGTAVPIFIAGTLFQYIFAIKLRLLPSARWIDFRYTILPTLTLAVGSIAVRTRLMRALMLEIESADYIRTAISKGLTRHRIVIHHQIRNAITPIISTMGIELSSIIMGSFVVEQIYAIPGLGAYYVSSIQNLDYTMVLGLTVFFSLFIVVSNLIIDIFYGIIDPRIRVYS